MHSIPLHCPIDGGTLTIATNAELTAINTLLEQINNGGDSLVLPDASIIPLPLKQAYLSNDRTRAYPVSPHGIPILIPEAAISMRQP